MNQIAKAAELALSTCPRSSWTAQPTCDYTGQRLAFDTMKRQLLDDALRAKPKLFVMIIHWALTGTWPKFRNAPVYFLNELLRWSAAKKSFVPETDFPDAPPPWEPKYAARFLDCTAFAWYSVQSENWARKITSAAFDAQEFAFQQMHPLE